MSANLQQANNELNSLDDVQDFIRGLTLLGTGGGGRPEAGLAALEPLVRAGARPCWTSLDSLPDDGTYCALAGLGSIAPTQPLSESERMDLGYPAQQNAEQGRVLLLRWQPLQQRQRLQLQPCATPSPVAGSPPGRVGTADGYRWRGRNAVLHGRRTLEPGHRGRGAGAG